VPGLLLRSLGCLLVSNALSSLTDRDCCRLLALLVLEIDTRDRKPVPRKDVRCFSVAQHGTSQKCSHCQRRQSKFKYGFHLYMRFPCKRICAHRCNPRGRQNPQEISEGGREQIVHSPAFTTPNVISSVYMSGDDRLEQESNSGCWLRFWQSTP
jgi:hypothetical protein